ncbi:MAG: putative terminase large subunit [Prokaryotic dsDNA virus sp.]|jgi:hypothetical protein|nr:terminase B [Parcubacteria group bacterium]QDP51289.1 MAG: putative terminase large subunit [Prokaryotic dsDNA virus sp.]|tara:strand:+ start:1235 stop:2671 length:1437 start_codon:yes stop_codon:yes gene_type:complete
MGDVIEISQSALTERVMSDLWDDRVTYVKEIVGVTPTDQQGDALVALDNYDSVVVKSGHGAGKSCVESWGVLHYMSCRPFPKVPCTAPSKHQLYDILWAELSKWHRQMKSEAIKSLFQWTKEKFFHKGYPEEWFAVARTAVKENPEALQGFHAEYLLKVIDEASGVPEPIFEVAEGATGHYETKALMCGNPTRLEGTFYDAFGKDREIYKTLSWSCLDSPIAPEKFVKRVERRYGLDSNIYRVRVLGEFPLRDGDAYIPYNLVEDAMIREIEPQTDKPIVFGVDVARYGNDATVIALRQGDEFKPFHVMRNKSTMETAAYVAHLANDLKPLLIFVDVIGIGAGVFDRLESLGLPVVQVNVAESPARNPHQFKRLRDELWGEMRLWLESRRGKLHDNYDNDLLGQLTTPKYKILSDGKIMIESKQDMKKRGVDSPDIADAFNMTFAQPVSNYSKEIDEFWEQFWGDEEAYAPLDVECGY